MPDPVKTAFDLLKAAFDGSGADGIALFAKLLVLHAGFVSVKVEGMIFQTGLIRGVGDEMDVAFEQVVTPLAVLLLRCPTIIGTKRGGSLGQVLTGMIPVHNLDAAGAVFSGQVPDPLRPIGGDRRGGPAVHADTLAPLMAQAGRWKRHALYAHQLLLVLPCRT